MATRPYPEKGNIPDELIEKMGALGYFGITIQEDEFIYWPNYATPCLGGLIVHC